MTTNIPQPLGVPAQEGFLRKILRRSREEPLIPLGLGLTIAAFVGAARAIRKHDHERANMMFRRRIYAQGFTVAVMVVGGWYFKDDRAQRKQMESLAKGREAAETREAWLRELEQREVDDRGARDRVGELREKKRRRAAEESERKLARDASATKQ